MSNTEATAVVSRRIRPLAPAVYLMSALLVIYPLLETTAGMSEFSPTQVRWRYGVVGLLMGASLLPMLGVLLAVATAHFLDHRRTQTALRVVGAVVLAALGVVIVMFALDAIQLRASIRPEVKPLYDRLSLKAMAMLLADTLFIATVSYTSLLASRELRSAERAARRSPDSPQIRVPTASQQP